MTKEYFKSFNIIYKREYVDPESEYDTFWSSATIYRNVPIEKIKYYRKQLLKIKDISKIAINISLFIFFVFLSI